ncbi:MAG: F0F1 ATP synthase subunit A [Nitrospiraceae bacterium]|nr:F0F1 ATP synthase subunit A [Nitrospiraceae bacterium]
MPEASPFSETLPLAGGIRIAGSVMMTWMIMALLSGLSVLFSRRLRAEPGGLQSLLEGLVMAMEEAIEAVIPGRSAQLLPFVSTLWIFIFLANMAGLVPGLSSPTSDLSVTSALAVLVFFSVHWFGIQTDGLIPYLRHYLSPTPFMLPFHLISELSRTLALAVRLFGNMMSLELTAVLVLYVAGPLVPIPILMLHIVEGVIQAYLFGMLALIYIAGGLQARDQKPD